MKPITRAQREAIRNIYYRGPIYKNGLTSPEIAMKAGWVFVEVSTLSDYWREKITNPRITHVWRNDRVSPIYLESDDIVKDYRLAEEMRYREFRATVTQSYDCLMVQWKGMWLGIETDGYTHS